MFSVWRCCFTLGYFTRSAASSEALFAIGSPSFSDYGDHNGYKVQEQGCTRNGYCCGTLAASLIGVTSLIFNAKGNPFGQFLMVIFSLLYGIISFTFSYYGEMLTYLGMTMPMAIFALISWLKNPHNGNKAEVKVNSLGKNERAPKCG